MKLSENAGVWSWTFITKTRRVFVKNSIRDNTKDIIRKCLLDETSMTADQANEQANDLADALGLDSKAADKVGPAKDVIIAVVDGIAHVVYRPKNLRVAVIDFDNQSEHPVWVKVE